MSRFVGDYDSKEARIAAARTQIAAFTQALDQFEIHNRFYPPGTNGLFELLQRSAGATNWHGPYLDVDAIPKDPWSHDFIYECPGKHNPASFDTVSAGPDGQVGTDDDIWNWGKR
jgi:general secretion pathway protein G